METPVDKLKLSPKDFFLYIGAIIGLYWSAGSLVALLFTITDTVFRDELQYYVDPYSGGIRFAIASLVVVFPVALLLFSLIKRAALKEPARFGFPLRRFLFALTIFFTSVALIGDLIALINTFLGGELTARFLCKVLSVFVVAAIVFWYCLLEIRVRPEAPIGVRKPFIIGTALFVLVAVVYGFVVMGSPATIRKLRFDERRTSDLQSIQWQIVNYWQQKGRFPKALADLEDTISGFRAPTDPETKTPYEFILGEGHAFKLCAVFELQSNSMISGTTKPIPTSPYGERGESWEHSANRVCFDRVIDPELYPVRPKGF